MAPSTPVPRLTRGRVPAQQTLVLRFGVAC